MPGLSSWEEDELFAQHGWEKNLIRREFEGPLGHRIDFDQVMDMTQSPDGEESLRVLVRRYGRVDGSNTPNT